MNKRVLIWGKPYKLPVQTDASEEGELSEEQKERLNRFLHSPELIAESLKPVLTYLKQLQSRNISQDFPTGYEEKEINVGTVHQLAVPTMLYLPDDDPGTVILLIETPLDPEQGMAVTFHLVAEGKDRVCVSSQGEVL